MHKTCSRCQEAKDKTLFYKMKAYRPNDDGFDYYCKSCRNASMKKTWSTNKKKCSTAGCEKPHYARTVCKCCYNKLIRREKKNK